MGKKDAVPPGSNAEVLTRFGGDVLDYAKCEFVTMVDVPLPDGIKYMLNRAGPARALGGDAAQRQEGDRGLPP
jgi:hypothetical protein